MTLCEVEAYEGFPQLKAIDATQSSTYTAAGAQAGIATHGIDGNKNCVWGSNALTHTESQKNSWWNANLGAVKTIRGVNTYNRVGCCPERLTNYEVRVGNDPNPMNNPACPGIHDGAKAIECNLKGQYAGVVLLKTDYLTVCEVEFFGY